MRIQKTNIKIQRKLFPNRTINQICHHLKTQPYRRLLQIVRETGGPVAAGVSGGGGGCYGLGSPRTAAAAAPAIVGEAGPRSPLAPEWCVAVLIPASTARLEKSGDHKWTKEESELMVRFEARVSPTRINQKIREANILPDRMLHSIKGHRRTVAYQTLLVNTQEELAETLQGGCWALLPR